MKSGTLLRNSSSRHVFGRDPVLTFCRKKRTFWTPASAGVTNSHRNISGRLLKFICISIGFFVFSCSFLQADITLHVLDVGYGTAIHLECGGRNYLFDVGSKKFHSQLLQHLADHGATHIDGIFLTHTHKDHAGGLLDLMRQIKTSVVFWNEKYPPDEDLVQELDEAHKYAAFKIPNPGETIPLGDNLLLHVFKNSLETDDLNSSGLVFGLSHGKAKLFLPGDIGVERQKNLIDLEGAWFKNTKFVLWPHHGDIINPSLQALLKPVKYCVLSVGENPYDLPKEAMKPQAQEMCNDLFNTQNDGTLSFAIHNNVTWLKKTKGRAAEPQ